MIFRSKEKGKTLKDFNIENTVVQRQKTSHFDNDSVAMGCSDGGCWSACFTGAYR